MTHIHINDKNESENGLGSHTKNISRSGVFKLSPNATSTVIVVPNTEQDISEKENTYPPRTKVTAKPKPKRLSLKKQPATILQYKYHKKSSVLTTSTFNDILSCQVCNQTYKNRSGLYKHMMTKHPRHGTPKAIRCKEQHCTFSCSRLHSLRRHLNDEHAFCMDIEHIRFNTIEGKYYNYSTCNDVIYNYRTLIIFTEFYRWKEECEQSTNTNFVKSTGGKIVQAGEEIKTYYYCSRSGYFNSESKGERLLKSQGTSKLNTYCTAAITLTKTRSQSIEVEYCKTHYEHKISLGHLRLADTDRKAIAGQLMQGVSLQHILDTIRNSVGSKFDRIHLLTKKDLNNIEKAFGIRSVQRHQDDATSVHLIVKEMEQTSTYNPILLYKPQSEVPQGKCSTLSLKDFALVLQTEMQAEMLGKFGPNQIVCIDDTHGTNGYNFTLITVMVVNEFGEGFPVAWCISNRQDRIVMEVFFQSVKDNVGDIIPKWIMTDDAEQFFTAWIKVFGQGPNKLLCAWHVDRAWRTNLRQIKPHDLAASIYHNLRVLLEEHDIEKFENLLLETLSQLSSSSATQQFCNYFSVHYANRKQQWASCYRISAGINTNMYVESFHYLLKYIYMKGRMNKRMDKCINILLSLARDKAFERLVKLEKGKISGRIKTIQLRHQASSKLTAQLITESGNSKWLVTSSDKTSDYTVTRQLETCPHKCLIRCLECDICVHEYTCTCLDHLIQSTICKHIHLVAQYCNLSHGMKKASSCTTQPNKDTTMLLKSLQSDRCIEYQEKIGKVRRKLLCLQALIEKCTNIAALDATEQLVDRALIVIDLPNQPAQFGSALNHPANKSITPQKAFFSTKRKRTTTNIRLAKPTHDQVRKMTMDLLHGTNVHGSMGNSLPQSIQGMRICILIVHCGHTCIKGLYY